MRVHGMTEDVGFGPYTILDLHELSEDGKSFELEDGWLVEVAASSRHNWVLRNLSRIIEDAAARAGSAVIVCEGGEWEISTPAGIRKPGIFVIPRDTARNGYLPGPSAVAGTELAADIAADKPFSVSFDPASLLDL
jgi:hypothetical protein